MLIQSQTSQRYSPATGRAREKNPPPAGAPGQPAGGLTGNFLPNAPQSVKDAWEKAEQEIGGESSWKSSDGMISRFSALMIQRIVQRFQTGDTDVFGSTPESAISGAEKILESIRNPLTPPSDSQAAAARETEALFFEKFIENLSKSAAAQGVSQTSEIGPTEIYEQLTGKLAPPPEPSYSLTDEQIADLKSRYDIENIGKEDYKALTDELGELGVLPKKKLVEGDTEFCRRPIILGIYPTEVYNKHFRYSPFEGGNYLDWAKSLLEKYSGAAVWIKESKENSNDAMTNARNLQSIQRFDEEMNRTLQVLERLK